ncbi:D-alanyl-D-alanine carboxypeptidase [Nonlabens dokdonensis DSW-6]|uniref:beta-lactamase n=2 Tax=Nonlabens dokdonensis TaxID=328515 RepID=L7WDZ9_NONDD|nr:D-alanyl-D-alanine carboxypeptidase [Nonlabens dokdonensis DSW-6]
MVIILVIAVAGGGYAIYSFFPEDDYVARFALENPDKSAMLIVRNDTVLIQQNIDKQMPLASTVKLIIAIEFAEQASKGLLNPDEKIAKEELLNYYVPNTDGGAHINWADSDETLEYGDSIPLKHIAKGMIQYSSNANTEWLMERLGLENINKQLVKLDFKHHSPIYPIVSSLFISDIYFKNLSKQELINKLNDLSEEQYIQYALEIHEEMKNDSEFRKQPLDSNEDIQRVWSNRLPAASASDYFSLMKKLNSKTYFNEQTQTILDEIIETSMHYKSVKEFYQHLGSKGGSTLFIMAQALYAQDQKGNRTEMVYFFNNLEPQERKKMTMSMSDFERAVLRDPKMAQKVHEIYLDHK